MLQFALAVVAAHTPGASTLTPPTAPAKPVDKVICREGAAQIGSMLPGKRVCRTRREWAAIDAANQRNADAMGDRDGHRAEGHN